MLWYNVYGKKHTPLQRNAMAAIPKMIKSTQSYLHAILFSQFFFNEIYFLLEISCLFMPFFVR